MSPGSSPMTKSFETVTTGKWILAGEHAVLRGCPALVFPLPSARLQFSYSPVSTGNQDIALELSGSRGAELDLLFWGVLEKACALTGLRRHQLDGRVKIQSEIPVGAGLGASAAFCVAIARWLSFEGHIEPHQIENFARELENLFHGESSGVDVAVAHGGKPIRFLRSGPREVLNLKWNPHCYLTFSGKRGVTRECVDQVKALWTQDPTEGARLDQQMAEAVSEAEAALKLDPACGQPQLLMALEKAAGCFYSWGLFDEACESKARELKTLGALMVKPTGSGGGGYLLSLWDHPAGAKAERSVELLSCFEGPQPN